MLNKKILLMLVFSVFIIHIVSAVDFVSSVIDPNEVYLNPSVVVDSNNTGFLFWSNGTDLKYTTTNDTSKIKSIFSKPGARQIGNIETAIAKNDIIHIVFSLYFNGQYRYYYMNTNSWTPIDLNVNYYENKPSIAVDPNPNYDVYIALVDALPGQEEDVVLLNSSDYNVFSKRYLNKPSKQLEPSLVVDSKGVIHLTWWDWREGISGGNGVYKIRYSNSLSNFEDEKVISLSNQSYNPTLQIDSEDNLFLAYKDADDSGLGFDGGNIYVYKFSHDTYQKVTAKPIFFPQDRPVGFAIDNNGVGHLVWTEWVNQGDEAEVYYANTNDLSNHVLQDTGYNLRNGYVAIDTYNDDEPIILAHISSIVKYETEEENQDECSCESLQEQIDDLNSRLNIIENIINSMREFSLFKKFWVWFDHPSECEKNEVTCDGDNLLKCKNSNWKIDKTCEYGCSDDKCKDLPKENCQDKPTEYKCNNGYSIITRYSTCKSKHGPTTSCDVGYCNYDRYSRYCGNGCNEITGLCKDDILHLN